MWYDYSIEQTRFEGAVELTHLSGAELEKVFVTSADAARIPAGRRTFLGCHVLSVDFRERGAESASPDRRMGRISSERLRQFQGSGDVTLQDESAGISLSADSVGFEKDRSLLSIHGSRSRKARIVVQRPGEFPQDYSAERFFYNLATRTIESVDQSFRGR
jgi:hypothetical protein